MGSIMGAIMASSMTVAVTGASGFVGRHLVRELLARGHRVRALVRDREKARGVLPRAGDDGGTLTLVAGDALDGRSPAELVRGVDACINLIGIIREEGGGQTFRRLHVGATRALVTACKESGGGGVRRFLQMSALGVHDDGKSAYQRTKFEGETIVRRSGLDWTIFRPSLIHGPEGEFIQMAAGWVTGDEPPYRFLPYFKRAAPGKGPAGGTLPGVDPVVQPVAVEDVATAFAEALVRPESIGEIYTLVGSERLTWPELLEFVRDRLPGANPRLKPLGVPSGMAVGVARAAKVLGMGGMLPFDEGMAVMGGLDATASLHKVRAHLGLDPMPFRKKMASYAGEI